MLTKRPKPRSVPALLLILYLISPYLNILPSSTLAGSQPLPPAQGPSDTSLPPGTVVNDAGWTKTQPSSCPTTRTTQQLVPASTWNKELTFPGGFFNGEAINSNITQTFTVGSDGTFSASDSAGNSYTIKPPGGLPSGPLTISLLTNSTTAEQNFLISSKSGMLANITVIYTIHTQNCSPELASSKSLTYPWMFPEPSASVMFAQTT